MKQYHFLVLIVAIIVLSACSKKENEYLSNAVRVKTFTSETQLHNALGSYLNGYDVANTSFDDPDMVYQGVIFTAMWRPKKLIDQPYTYFRSIYHVSYPDKKTKEEIMQRFSSAKIVSDERLNNSRYSNIIILTGWDNRKTNWNYQLFVMHRGEINVTEEVQLNGGFHFVAGAAGEAEWFAQAPAPPNDKDVITALLNLLEPIP